MPNYCYCGRSEMQPFCDGSHNVVPARKPNTEKDPPPPLPSAESPAKTGALRPGLLRRLFGRS